MRWKLLPLLPLLALLASPAFGNCEAGGYMIHTLAEYKPYEAHRSVLPYWKEGGDRLGFQIQGGSEGLSSPTLRLAHAGETCTGTHFSRVERRRTARRSKPRSRTSFPS